MSEKNVFLTNDRGNLEQKKMSETDRKVLEQAASGAGCITLSGEEGAAMLREMAIAAKETHEEFLKSIKSKMTHERAVRIREVRIDEEGTWRYVAETIHKEWGADAEWTPPSNQLAGMALCQAAAEVFGEDSNEEPWN